MGAIGLTRAGARGLVGAGLSDARVSGRPPHEWSGPVASLSAHAEACALRFQGGRLSWQNEHEPLPITTDVSRRAEIALRIAGHLKQLFRCPDLHIGRGRNVYRHQLEIGLA